MVPSEPKPQAAVTRAFAVEPWVTRQVVMIIVAQVVFGFGWSLYLLTPKFMAAALHAGPDVIGLASAAGGLAALLTVPFAATGLDRLGRLLFFRLGTLLIVLLSFGFMQVHEVSPLLYVLQGCISAAFVLSFNATAALLADYTPADRLGQAIGWLGGASVLMNAVATTIAEPLAMRYGWHVVFVLGVIAGTAAFAISFALKDMPSRDAGRATDGAANAPHPQSTSLGAILFASVLLGCVFSAMFSFVQPYALSLGAIEVRDFFIGFSAAAVACRVFLGSLGDRLGRKVVSTWMLCGYALCALITARLEPNLLILYGLAFGAAHGVLYPTMSALILEVVSDKRRGLAMVLFNGAFNVGTALSGLGWGMLAKHHGYPAVYTTASALALVGAGVLSLNRARASQA